MDLKLRCLQAGGTVRPGQAIIDFVGSATTPGPGFVPVADRIATFDNDGTLWVEQPLPQQFDFVFRRWGEEIKADPSLAEQQPYKAIIARDPAFFAALGVQDPEVVATLLTAFARTWKGTTPDEFDAQVREWLQTSKQPKLGVPYIELVYKPMLELLDYLRAHEFRVFVVSGGGRDFMRVFAEDAWGIYKENVIGTAAEYSYADGKVVRGEHARRRSRCARRQARAHLRCDRQAADVRRRQRRHRHRDAGGREVLGARQPRRRGARVRLYQRGRGVIGKGEGAGLDRREHEKRLEHRLLEKERTG
jgi:phosphoglycolate phosphatase-like HAD superfamily hydrolase